MNMPKTIDRPPLTAEEAAEKRRLKSAYERHKHEWESAHGVRLTQERLGQAVADILRRKDPFTQGVVWQYLSDKSDTKLNTEFVHGMARLLGFDPAEISPRFAPLYKDKGDGEERYSPSIRAMIEELEAAGDEEQKRALEVVRIMFSKNK